MLMMLLKLMLDADVNVDVGVAVDVAATQNQILRVDIRAVQLGIAAIVFPCARSDALKAEVRAKQAASPASKKWHTELAARAHFKFGSCSNAWNGSCFELARTGGRYASSCRLP